MSRISDIQAKAQSLRQQHQQATEQQLQSDIEQAVNDTTRCLQQRVSTINSDIDRSNSEILSHHTDSTTALLQQIDQTTAKVRKQQQQGMTALLQQIDQTTAKVRKQQQQGMTALLQEQQAQITQLQASLAKLNGLSQETAQAARVKKNPYHVEYSLDFNSVYRSYLLYLSDIRYQKQEQRDAGKNSTITADRSSYTTENSGIQYSGGSTVQGERGR